MMKKLLFLFPSILLILALGCDNAVQPNKTFEEETFWNITLKTKPCNDDQDTGFISKEYSGTLDILQQLSEDGQYYITEVLLDYLPDVTLTVYMYNAVHYTRDTVIVTNGIYNTIHYYMLIEKDSTTIQGEYIEYFHGSPQVCYTYTGTKKPTQ